MSIPSPQPPTLPLTLPPCGRSKPVSQLKAVSDSYAVIMVDTLHKYRAGLFDAARLHQAFDAARQNGSQAWKQYTATRLTEEEKRRVSELDQA